MHNLFAIAIDSTFHLGDIIVMIIASMLGWIGHSIKRTIDRYLRRVAELEDRQEDHAGVIDTHSVIFKGMGRVEYMPRQRQRRRAEDIHEVG